MLKLTNSFYRYLLFTCEKGYTAHVRRLTHLNIKRKTCSSECRDITLTAQFHSSAQLLKHSHGKKRLKIKIPPLSANEYKKHNPMTDPLQPTNNHASYGGCFEVSSSNETFFRRDSGQGSPSHDNNAPDTQPIPPDFRIWETVNRHNGSNNGGSVRFKVLSYNVLAQMLLESHPYLYTGCAPRDLKWKVRASRIFDEIMSLTPDIICLQEVQETHLSSFYSKFEQVGYLGIFKQKTGHRHDGCAIYFKQSLFELKDHINVEFYQPQLPLLNRDNVGVMAKLRVRGGGDLVVATTHLLYNPKRTDVRLAQMQLFLAEIDRFAYYDNGTECGYLPIILTGDFNSTPDSAVIQLLDRGNVSASPFRDSSDWQRIGVMDNCQHLAVYLNRQQGRDTDFSKVKIYNSEYCGCPGARSEAQLPQFSGMFNGDELGHALNLASVYERVKPDGRCEASTFQDFWITVDYIYFSCCSSLRLLERLRLPTASECEVLGTLPNHVYGSDHLALAAVFELRSRL